ncbi:hypothetical protein [Cryptosporidium parvum Iowa II]|uniref:Predicted secreted protein n=2 Tax=Cryptosporidium parvum TaxID=5807 RepID=Q5CVL7_CRYPI|nr:hypothetical protein [Cryptosporidium parvum Iowa II]EAK89521.1 predicted secreted protein [Cryptosporidium parvum Iowa II]QOY40124.1 putative Secreted Protein (WYLE gene family) [Cryptosporidium parvum]WKS79620.1 putative secreted protein [Cryptosporidium sp. 43IA8]WRK34122.1 putative Secreted Protein (WYLE gene family) [Cryptosporidium parvum]|eukprot:QOY40124.1 hypothetical protein CPATCC_004207 [Cryptosporidium parvum]
MRLTLIIIFISTFIPILSKKSSKTSYNPDNILVGVDNQKNNHIYNSQYRIRVRKMDPFLRTVVIKGIEPNFPNDINADGTSPLSENIYSKLPIRLHVPIIPIDNSVKIRRMPVISQSSQRLPLEASERLFSYAIGICKIPSLWYLELIYCMHRGVTHFTTGILTSYTLQDIIGASLASMDLPSESFSLAKCKASISLFSDIAINKKNSEVCSMMLTCLTSKEFLRNNKNQVRKLEKEITDVYKDKPPFFRGQQPRSYAQKIIVGILMARREKGYGPAASKNDGKKIKFPDKLFYVIRYFNFIMILTEYLIRQGLKDIDAFEISPKAYMKIGDKSLLQPTPIKMIAKCARLIINAHLSNNSVDYLSYFDKTGFCPFSNVIIQHACTELVSMGFINSEIEIPKNISINELEYLAYPHLAHSREIVKEQPTKKIKDKTSSQVKSADLSSKSRGAFKQNIKQKKALENQSPKKKVQVQFSDKGAILNNRSVVTRLDVPKNFANKTSNESNSTEIESYASSNSTSNSGLKKQLEDILSTIDID